MSALNFPDAPSPGQVFDSWVWDGTKWVATPAAGGGGSGDFLPLTGGTITGNLVVTGSTQLAGATAATAAAGNNSNVIATTAFVTQAIGNAPFLPIAGGTLTGPLLLPAAAPTNTLQAVDKAYVDGLAGTLLPIAGGTMTGALFLPAAAPTVGTQAVNKSYVDGLITTVNGSFLPLIGGTVTGNVFITRNAAVPAQAPPNNTVLDVIGADNTGHIFLIDGYTNSPGQSGSVQLRKARGTGSAPTALLSGDIIGAVQAIPRGTTQYGPGPQIQLYAAENITDTAFGGGFRFRTATIGTNTLVQRLQIQAGLVVGATAVDLGQGTMTLNASTSGNIFTGTAAGTAIAAGAIEGQSTRLILQSSGAGIPGIPSILEFRSSTVTQDPNGRGSTQAFDQISNVIHSGFDGTNFATGAIEVGQALENWSPTARGTRLAWETTALGAATPSLVMFLSRGLSLGSTGVDPGFGSLVLNANAVQPSIGLSQFTIIGADEQAPIERFVAIGNGVNAQPQVNLIRARGTGAAPAAVLVNDVLGQFNTSGYDGTAWTTNVTAIVGQATSNWANNNHGSRMGFWVTPNFTVNNLVQLGDMNFAQGCQFQGTQTNDNVAAGWIGEFLSAISGGGTAMADQGGSSGTNIATLSLTAGDWDVEGLMIFRPTGTMVGCIAAINTTSATIPAPLGVQGSTAFGIGGISDTLDLYVNVPTARISIAATTNVFLVGQMQGTAGTGFGNIRARRVR